MPISLAAAAGSLMPGSWIAIWSPLLRDDRLGDAELVDPLPDDRDRAVEVGLLERLPLRRLRLQRHLETALEVETQRCLLVDGRARDTEQDHADEGCDDGGENDDGVATVHCLAIRLDPREGVRVG